MHLVQFNHCSCEVPLQITENASLKAELFKSTNKLRLLKKSLNDLEQYTRRDCLEICGIPLPSTPTDVDQTDNIVLQIGEKIGVPYMVLVIRQ